jgi:hypothetical protein
MMEFHPAKCQVLRITKKRKPIPAEYSIHGHTLEIVPHAKYLGLTLSNTMSWNNHIDSTAKKAHNTLGFLRRNMFHCPRDVKTRCYQTLVRPIAEYAACVWDPHTKSASHKIEMVQRQAARYCCNDYSRESSVTTMLDQLGWETLAERRAKAKVLMAYKAQNSVIDVPSEPYRSVPDHRTRGQTLFLPYIRTIQYQHSYYPSSIKLWNQLPHSVVIQPSLPAFRTALAGVTLLK